MTTLPRSPRALLRDPLVLASLVFMLFWGFVAMTRRPIGDFGVETDFYGDFAVYAREWAAGHPTLMNGFRGPLYYIVLAALSKVAPDLFWAAKLVSILSAGVALWFTGDLVRRLWTPAAGAVALFLMASSPTFIDYSYRACNDVLFLALVTGSLNLLLRAEGAVARPWLAAGALGGLAWLTRYNGSVLVPAALLAAAILYGRSRRALVAAGAYVGAWLVVALPWILYVMARTGSPFWNKAYENVAIEVLTDDPNRAQTTGFMTATNVASLKDVWDVDPALFLKTMARNLIEHVRLDATAMVSIPWTIVAVAGALLAWSSWRNRRALAFLATGLLTYLSLLPVFYNERFMLPLLPYWGAMAGGTVVFLTRMAAVSRGGEVPRPVAKGAAKARRPAGAGPPLPIIGGLAVLSVLALVMTAAGYRLAVDPGRFGGTPGEYPALLKDALRRNVPLGPTHPIAARKPHFPYLAGSPMVPVPTGSIDQLRASGAHYLLVSASEVMIYPSLASIWTPKSLAEIPEGLASVAGATWRRPNGDVTAATLYAVIDPVPYVKKESNPFKREAPVPPGFSRIDFIRLQLGEWILKSGAPRDPDMFFRLISPAARDLPRAALARAAAAIRRHDLPEAERLYRVVLEQAPGDRDAWLGLAGASFLAGKAKEREEAVRKAFGLPAGTAPAVDSLKAESEKGLRLMQTPQSLGAATAALWTEPGTIWALKSAAYSLQALAWVPEARTMALEAQKLQPDDPELITMLRSLPPLEGP
jgi:4-amino-4-deoxy-L-arabinose transferase-like glycosyltransferase